MHRNIENKRHRKSSRISQKFSIFIPILILFIPFSYFSFGEDGPRAITAIIPLVLLWAIIFSRGLNWTTDATIYIIILLYMSALSLYGGNWNIFFAATIFLFLAYWPILFPNRGNDYIDINRVSIFYSYVSALFSLGVILQYCLFTWYGVKFGKIDEMYQRTGFGFLWTDYSFASIYLASGFITAIYSNIRLINKYIILSIIFVGMIATTARSGFAALAAFYVYDIIFSNSSRYGSFAKRMAYGISILICCGALLFFFEGISNREYNFDSSGRIDGYRAALSFIYDNILFGSYLDTDSYVYMVDDAIPHNAEIYIMTVGGIGLFLIWILWITIFLSKMKNTSPPIKGAIYVSFIGLQLVPSFFAAYFFSLLMSFSILERIHNRK